MNRCCVLGLGVLLSACAIPNTIESLDRQAPPPEFGRPGWVRTSAGIGAWIGGITGGVLSIALLPITFPVSLVAGDSLGEQGREELLFFPALSLAAIGHGLLGVPADLVDGAVRRIWITSPSDPVNSYEWTPMPAADLPQPLPPAAVPEPPPGEPAAESPATKP